MNKKNCKRYRSQKGIGMIMLLMIAAILLIFAAMAIKVTYSLHKQNQQSKVLLQKKVDSLKT